MGLKEAGTRLHDNGQVINFFFVCYPFDFAELWLLLRNQSSGIVVNRGVCKKSRSGGITVDYFFPEPTNTDFFLDCKVI